MKINKDNLLYHVPWTFFILLVDIYSKANFRYKFWSHVFQLFLTRNQDGVIQWGGTISNSCKQEEHRFKLVLHLLVLPDEESILDTCNAEMARKANMKKVYQDKLKSTIAPKCHPNAFLKQVPQMCARDVPLRKMLILQIAGFNGRLSVLALSKEKEYSLDEVSSFCFPRSLTQIQQGSLENLINVLASIDVGFIEWSQKSLSRQ